MKVVPDQISRWVAAAVHPLGTDGYGFSDTRGALRRHFETDAAHVVVAVLHGLAQQGELKSEVVAEAIRRYELDPDASTPGTPEESRLPGSSSSSSSSSPSTAQGSTSGANSQSGSCFSPRVRFAWQALQMRSWLPCFIWRAGETAGHVHFQPRLTPSWRYEISTASQRTGRTAFRGWSTLHTAPVIGE